MNRILIVDDDVASATALQVLLNDQGYDTRVEYDSPRALEAVREYKPDAVLIDYMMPKAHGGDVAWQLCSSEQHETRIVLYSHLTSEEIRPKLPPKDIPILQKPVSVEMLLALLRRQD